MLRDILAGAIMLNAWAIFVFFLRFWRKTGDELFAYFASAFLLLGIERMAIMSVAFEMSAYVYLIRLCSFGVIIFAIVNKNVRDKGK